MELVTQIHELLAQYLSGQISLRDFKRRFVSATWDVAQLGNRDAERLVYEIELRLAEFSNGHWTEPEFKRILRPILETYRVGWSEESVRTGVSAETIPARFDLVAGIRHVGAFA
jgi:hypothetical protein